MPNIRQIDFNFPKHWQRLKSRGAANFTTQVIHRLPSGNLHIWSSRRFRKRHGTEIRAREKNQPHEPQKKYWKYWGLINFIGSVCFTIGSYAALLEAINLNLDVKLEWDAEIIVEKIGNVRHSSPPLTKFKWFDWQPHRLECQSTLIQFIGACLFNLNCFFSMTNGLTWQTVDLIVWLPSTLASAFFCGASYLSAVKNGGQTFPFWRDQSASWEAVT